MKKVASVGGPPRRPAEATFLQRRSIRTIIWRFDALNPGFLAGARCVSRRLRLRQRLDDRGFVFRSNEVRLLLSLIAYNLGNLWRRLFGAMVRRIAALPLPTG